MKRLFPAFAAVLLATTASFPLHANVVAEWSERSSGASYVMADGPGTGGARLVAMAHVVASRLRASGPLLSLPP